MKRELNYDLNAIEQMRSQLEDAVKMTSAQIGFNYLMKVHGDGFNQLVGVPGLLALVGLDKAIKFINRANKSLGDVCRCKVYNGVEVSFYIH